MHKHVYGAGTLGNGGAHSAYGTQSLTIRQGEPDCDNDTIARDYRSGGTSPL